MKLALRFIFKNNTNLHRDIKFIESKSMVDLNITVGEILHCINDKSNKPHIIIDSR